MTSEQINSAPQELTAFDRCRAASSLRCRSDDSYKTLFFEAIYQQRADIVQSFPIEQIILFIDSVDGTGRTPLIHSVLHRDVNTCRILLQIGCDINKRDETMWTALHHAAEGGYEDIFKLLLDNKANPERRTRQKYTPLHIATLNERIGIISILQSVNIRINAKDTNGRTPLNLAIERKMKWKTIRILLDMGADPNIPNKKSENPVLLAAIFGRLKLASRIIKHAKVPFRSYNLMDLKGNTLLHAAVKENVSINIFQTLLGGDSDLDIINPQGKSPLLVAAELGYLKIAQELISAGADINRTDLFGKTPLYIAAREGHEDIIFTLFTHGTPVSYCQDPFLPTALHVAIFKEREENLIFTLLLSDDELEMHNVYGQTPLLLAMLKENAHAVNILVKSGAKVDVTDIYGVTPIKILRHSVNLKLFVAYLGELDSYEAGDTEDVLNHAIEKNMVEYVEALLQNGAVIEQRHCNTSLTFNEGYNDNTIPNVLLINMLLLKPKYTLNIQSFLLKAVDENNAEMISKIIQSGIDPNDESYHFSKPLVRAINNKYVEAAEALLKAGCEPTYHTKDRDLVENTLAENQSMKDLCSKYGVRMEEKKRSRFEEMNALSLMEFVKNTIKSGKEFLNCDISGDTVLHAAAEIGDLEILKLIIDNGIDINVKNYKDKTALYVAVEYRFMDGVDFLLAHRANVNVKNYLGKTPLNYSMNGNNTDLSLKLLDAGANTSIAFGEDFMVREINKGNVRFLQELRNRNITPKLKARDVDYIERMTMNHNQSKEEMLKYLINALRDGDENGENALFGAIYKGRLDLIRNILRLEPKLVNSVHKKTGESVLHVGLDVLTKINFLKLLNIVETIGGDLDKLCFKKYQSPLEKCIQNNRMAEAALLVSMKADCTYAISLASSMKQELLVQMMIDAGATPPPHWPKQALSLQKLATIACRKYIPQKGFRMAIKSLELGMYENILLLEDQCDKIIEMPELLKKEELSRIDFLDSSDQSDSSDEL